MINSIIFDAEGVVIDTEDIWDEGQRRFLEHRGLIYDRETVKPMLTGRSVLDGVRVMQAHYGFGGDPEAMAQERVTIIEELFRSEVRFIDGFEEFFARIRGAYKTCIATALNEDLLAIAVEVLGLRSLFDDRIFSLTHVNQRAKPNPDLFLHAARQLNSNSTECVVIEDSPLGIEAARRAEMLSIGLATTYEPARLNAADLVVRAFSEIDLGKLQWEVRRGGSPE